MLNNVGSVLVTGATGFIGSALALRLSHEGVRTFCLVRRGSPGICRIGELARIELLEAESFDCATLTPQLSKIEADVVFNLASSGVAPDDRDPHRLLAGNLDILVGVIGALSQRRLRRFIHIGSCSEYTLAAQGRRLTEEDPLVPVSLYGAAKACSYIYGAALAKLRNIPFSVLRLFGVFGPGEAQYRLVPYVINHLRRDTPVDLTGGEQVRDFLYVDDVVQAMLLAAESDALASGCSYNICSGQGVSIRAMAEEVAEAMSKPKSLLRFGARPYRSDEPMWLVGDNQRFRSLTGWTPRVTLGDGIRQMISVLGKA